MPVQVLAYAQHLAKTQHCPVFITLWKRTYLLRIPTYVSFPVLSDGETAVMKISPSGEQEILI